jgi:hypothetical protein
VDHLRAEIIFLDGDLPEFLGRDHVNVIIHVARLQDQIYKRILSGSVKVDPGKRHEFWRSLISYAVLRLIPLCNLRYGPLPFIAWLPALALSFNLWEVI